MRVCWEKLTATSLQYMYVYHPVMAERGRDVVIVQVESEASRER